ncbi:RNA binding protein Pumilio [Trichosporon asahii var. asahii CBS 2479]|uniref:RNA binding protein Pumilio n=1 Tax=Trichosporon asahii var. asahii (strain ATCC 90039 / CBS 2479 / JCM 2466 / KCTC 7840 / NBRC 103889/ NCYC 2677 / UAMH 7654) TaxID=1186058 RepID=J6F691_TRIAS|nr:RNA binding protein Pumilio [Trichosporon asahii var. asahii CBS 2479]EJT50837.1 RNA binding protein Pumilio [Trichosporon asahii var. asahii CBS 2479]
MSGAAATSWAQPASDSNDIASHMSNLSVDDYGSPHRQNASPGAPPPPGGPYANVHTPPRPAAAFNPYDPFIYYAGVDPSTFTPNGAGAPQGYPYADVTTPLQAMATGANVYGDPYPSPPETYGSHTPDARSPGQVPAALTAFQHQLVAATAGARSQQVYRPPHTGQQLQVPHQLPTPPQQGYYNYIERGVYWHPRQNSHGHQAQMAQPNHYPTLADYANHAQQYTLQSPPMSTFGSPPANTYALPSPYAPYSPPAFGYGRQLKRDDSSVVRSQRLEEFRSRKSSRLEFSIYGSICEFASDQHGSRFIQNKLETASPEERQKVFEEILPNAFSLMTDVFGNYVIQKLFEHGDAAQKAALIKKMEGQALFLSNHMYGCRVMQTALEHARTEDRAKLVAELDGHIIECVKSSNANHVIQRLITLDPPRGFMDAFIGHVRELSTHPFGCRVLQKSFEVLPPEKIRPLLDEMHTCSHELMINQFGNYVVQSVITEGEGRKHDRDLAVAEIKTRIFDLCRHKFASNVVEKALKHANPADKRELISEMIGDDSGENRIQTLLRDQYGNFPVQTALAEAEKDQRDKLLSIIIPLMPNLRHTPCGRRLEGRINELESKGELPSLTSGNAWESPTLSSESESNTPETPGAATQQTQAQVNGNAKGRRSSPAAANNKEEKQVLVDLLS